MSGQANGSPTKRLSKLTRHDYESEEDEMPSLSIGDIIEVDADKTKTLSSIHVSPGLKFQVEKDYNIREEEYLMRPLLHGAIIFSDGYRVSFFPHDETLWRLNKTNLCSPMREPVFFKLHGPEKMHQRARTLVQIILEDAGVDEHQSLADRICTGLFKRLDMSPLLKDEIDA